MSRNWYKCYETGMVRVELFQSGLWVFPFTHYKLDRPENYGFVEFPCPTSIVILQMLWD